MKRILVSLIVFACVMGLESSHAAETQNGPRLLAPHPFGPVGLFRTLSAETQPAGARSFGVSLSGSYFNLNGFPATGTDTERLVGRAALSYTPIQFLEFFVAGSALTSSDSSAASLIQQIGNLDFGAKIRYPITSAVSLGVSHVGHLQRPLGDRNLTAQALSHDLLALASFDLQKMGVPLLIHVNGGYRIDDTSDLIDPTSTTDERDRVILGVLGQDSILGAIGFEIPVKSVALSLEYSTEQVRKASGVGILGKPQRITAGIRYFPTQNRALSLQLASDIGFFATDRTARVVREPEYAFLFGVNYLFGVAAQAQPAPAPVAPAVSKTGYVVGKVTDQNTGQVVGGARIELCGDIVSPVASDPEAGTYRSYPIPEGSCEITASHDRYQSVTQAVQVVADTEATQDFALVRKDALKGILSLSVKDENGAPLKAMVSFPEISHAREVNTNEQGRIRVRLPVGNYAVAVKAEDKKPETLRFDIREGQESFGEFVLKQKTARLEEEAIVISKKIQFATGKAVVRDASKEVLEEVAWIIKDHAEIKMVEIQGHTDSRGNPKFNLKLSQKRAQAVRDYLISLGVEATRLKAVGYGKEKPIASNRTREGRAANRRVEFKILKK